MVFISLGSNLGNRLHNLWQAVEFIKQNCLRNVRCSIVLETKAILPEGAPLSWNKPFLNMIISGETNLSPEELLKSLLEIENLMGRVRDSKIKWSPRIIDLDILFYKDLKLNLPNLIIPHPEINNRNFLGHLLSSMGLSLWKNHYFKDSFFRTLTLSPRLVGILNVTKDSFSDGGNFYKLDDAVNHVIKLSEDGASVIDIGAQSTRPGAIISPWKEEYVKLQEILNVLNPLLDDGTLHISIDTFQVPIIKNLLKKYKISWINDVKGSLDDDTLRLIADSGCKLCVMHSLSIPASKDKVLPLNVDPMNLILDWGQFYLDKLVRLGFSLENIILDPGIGFGKTAWQNISLLKCIKRLKELGVLILLGHSRKSYMEAFCRKQAAKRDLETIAMSLIVKEKVDFLRVHNVRDHMRSFVAQHILEH